MIEIISIHENEDNQIVYFKITTAKDTFEWHGSCPKDEEPQAYFEAMADKLHFLLLQKMYHDGDTWADWPRFKADENTELQAMQEWIAKGHKNKIQIGLTKAGKPIYEYRIIEKQSWRSTHPPSLAMAKDIDALDVKEDLKNVLKRVIIA